MKKTYKYVKINKMDAKKHTSQKCMLFNVFSVNKSKNYGGK